MNDLKKSATNAAATIAAIYEWVDRVNEAGGATSIEGVAMCNAMLKSLNSQKPRVQELVVKPLMAALEGTK